MKKLSKSELYNFLEKTGENEIKIISPMLYITEVGFKTCKIDPFNIIDYPEDELIIKFEEMYLTIPYNEIESAKILNIDNEERIVVELKKAIVLYENEKIMRLESLSLLYIMKKLEMIEKRLK